MEIRNKATTIQTAEPNRPIGLRSENIATDPMVDRALSDAPPWSMSQIFGKKRLVTSIDITTSSTGLVYEFINSVENVLSLFANPDLTLYFNYIRYDIVFDLEVQSHFQHQGALLVGVWPLARTDVWYTFNNVAQVIEFPASITNLVKMPHDFITFGHNGNYRVTLPWMCNQNMLPIRTQSSNDAPNRLKPINSLNIYIFDQLRAVASAVGTSTLRIWANLENIKYSGYVPRY